MSKEWSDREELPTGNPIGDIDDRKDELKIKGGYDFVGTITKKDIDDFFKNGPIPSNTDECHKAASTGRFEYGSQTEEKESSCKHPNKYKNIISASVKFWYCPCCKEDLGDA